MQKGQAIPMEEAKMLQEGSIVCSKAGHDAGGFFVVLRMEGEYLWLADGKRRKLDRPKRKKVKHTAKTNRCVELSMVDTDKKIRRVLQHFGQPKGEATAE